MVVDTLAAARIQIAQEEDFRFADGVEEAGTIENAIQHNLQNLKNQVSLTRPIYLVMPLRSITMINQRIKALKVLAIGPRTEAEIYTLTACGFDPANITGVDLISYSDLIDVGDMHALPYPDNSFDVIVMGWVLAYTSTPEVAAREALRVARPGAYFAVGCEYTPFSEDQLEAQGSLVAEGGKYRHTDDILKLFGDQVESVIFRHEVHPKRIDQPDGIMTIFQIGE